MATELMFTKADDALLAAMATFRFLTIQQAVRLGICGRENAGVRLERLRKAGLVGCFAGAPTQGPHIHWLTERGARVAQELVGPETPLNVPSKAYSGGAHLRARVAIVDCHIAVVQWAAEVGATLDDVRIEYARNLDGRLRPATALDHGGQTYTPDAIFQVTGPDGERHLMVLELEWGGYAHSPQHFRHKMPSRAAFIRAFGVEKALGWTGRRRAMFLFVFATADMLAAALRILPEPSADFWRAVAFKAHPAVVANFAAEWSKVDGSSVELLPKSPEKVTDGVLPPPSTQP